MKYLEETMRKTEKSLEMNIEIMRINVRLKEGKPQKRY